MEEFQKESCVRGYHLYKDVWNAVLGEELLCRRGAGNSSDLYTVAVLKDGTTIGHLPRKISARCS